MAVALADADTTRYQINEQYDNAEQHVDYPYTPFIRFTIFYFRRC